MNNQLWMERGCEGLLMADKITLREAMETPVWMIVYAANPERNVDVTMTYADLFKIYGMAQKGREQSKLD